MLWVIILVGTKLFLRIDEVLYLQMEAFLPHHFVVKSGDVVSLLVEIKGKRDKQKIHFNLTDDDVCPEFSPVRMVHGTNLPCYHWTQNGLSVSNCF
jgi:hypothetical protein